MPLSENTDQPMAQRVRNTKCHTIVRTQLKEKNQLTLFLSKMIEKLKWTLRTTPQSKIPNTKTQSTKPQHTMGATTNNE